jgi:hypothetical protein
MRDFALRLDESDSSLLVGSGAAPAGLFLAAYDWPAVIIDQDIRAVEAVEQRAAAEELASKVQALVVRFGHWFPDITPTLVVVDPAALAPLDGARRCAALDTIKSQTTSGGVHCILPSRNRDGVIPLTSETLIEHYSDWWVQRLKGENSRVGFRAVKP